MLQLEFVAKLKSERMDDNQLSQWVLLRRVDGKLTINRRMLQTGRYGLEIYVGKEGFGRPFHHISTYLVNVSAEVPRRIKFPELPYQHAGERRKKSK